MFKRKFTPEAASLIKKLSPSVRSSIRSLTDRLLINLFEGKPLQRELEGHYSLKHSRYRVIYSLNEKSREIIIEYVGSRDTVYELFEALVKRQKL